MPTNKFENEPGVERLRRAIGILDYCNETFNYRWTAAELLKIVDAHLRSGWDIFPDEWSEDQLRAAIDHGTPPTFKE
jgi:hypothetical protein